MRIAYLPDGETVNAFYRSRGPMLALAARGHDTRELRPDDRRAWDEILGWCDVLHVHRVCDGGVVRLVQVAKERGALTVWDDDDDVTQVPRQSASHRVASGFAGTRRLAARDRLFGLVDLVTSPSRVLSESFRAAGASHVAVIENYVPHDDIPVHRRGSEIVIGWVAGSEHRLDLERIPVREALERLLSAHPQTRVTTIGLGLGLDSDRYRHVKLVPFPRLLSEVAAFDIGIAPLSPDWRINHARSNIKLKEYAVAGVPWLASPIGPYAEMGNREGGCLVADDDWYDVLETLVLRQRARHRLAKRAARWGRGQTLVANSARWESAFADAIALRT